MNRRGFVAVATAFVLAACTGGGGPKPTPSLSLPTPSATPSRTFQGEDHAGSLVFGAEQWPECVNPLTACADADWTWYSVLQHVLPRAMQLDQQGNFVASPLLRKAASLENGGVTQNPFTIRFEINDQAVWEDGTPITSEDFWFTWRAVVSTRGATRTSGYDLISSMDTSDPKSAVVRFKDIYVDWPDLFGGVHGFVLKAAAFPEFTDDPTPDLSQEMADAIPFSGGPWILESWSQDQAVLIRNDHYFGDVPLLDKVVFIPTTDLPGELNSMRTGEIDAIYADATEASLLVELKAPGVTAVGTSGNLFEALWLNVTGPPLDNALVREAVLFAIDRSAVVEQLVKQNDPEATVLNCGFEAFPGLGPWCRTEPFQRYTYDPSRARALLEEAGYDCSASPCTKNGKRLVIDYPIIPNRLRPRIQDVLVPPALAAGVELRPKSIEPGGLFGGDFGCPVRLGAMSGCSHPVRVDPSVTDLFACDRIPTRSNGYSGTNRIGWCDPRADLLMKASDRALDVDRRQALLDRVYELEAEDAIGLPLFVRRVVSAWRSSLLAGPIGVWSSTPYGLFFNMNEWYLVQG